MNLTLIHFYPDLMSLYGSYANLLVLRRNLEALGNTVAVREIRPGDAGDLTDADFLFMGAGTERAQKAALEDFRKYGAAVKEAASRNIPMLFAGTAMELLGKTIIDADGKTYDGIGLASFTAKQSSRRIVEDVLGRTEVCREPIVGFVNKSSILTGIDTPLLTTLSLGFGNEKALGPEGFRRWNVLGSHLTGPLLVKNPRLLDAVVDAIYKCHGEVVPADRPRDTYAEEGYVITAQALEQRAEAAK